MKINNVKVPFRLWFALAKANLRSKLEKKFSFLLAKKRKERYVLTQVGVVDANKNKSIIYGKNPSGDTKAVLRERRPTNGFSIKDILEGKRGSCNPVSFVEEVNKALP